MVPRWKRIEGMRYMEFDVSEEQRQTMILALAHLSLKRPGWDNMLKEIAIILGGPDMFEEFRVYGASEKVTNEV